MPRPERRLDPHADAVQRFAVQLRGLRKDAGNVSYRQMARTAHYSPATLAAAAGGRRLPTLEVTLAYVRACHGDEDHWRRLWLDIQEEQRVEPADTSAPYLGLAAFSTGDGDRFFGRDQQITQLRAKMRERSMVAVVGSSGSGKSSLLRAGLLATCGEKFVLCTPGADPFQECAIPLGARLGLPAGDLARDLLAAPGHLGLALRQVLVKAGDETGEVILVVDQFEEIFTLCQDAGLRERFIDALLSAAHDRVRVVLGLRADFYGHCTQHTSLLPVLRDGQVLLGAMTVGQLRDVIVKPATLAGLRVEDELMSRLIDEAQGQAGVLPLVSHALLETWHRRRGNALTLAGYEASGGLTRAVANTAEQVWATLEPDQRSCAKDILLRLVALGDGTEDTKRRISWSELDYGVNVEPVLDAMARARLLTLGSDSVEITHEALIRGWPRLRQWLREGRDQLRIHRQLTDATRLWEALGEDPGSLYRGTRLARVQEAEMALTVSEHRFVTASLAAQRREQRRSRRLVAVLVILLVLVTTAGSIVFVQGQQAVDAEAVSRSRQLAAEARNTAASDVPEAIRLALAAYAAHPTLEARSAVLSLASHRDYQARFSTPGGIVLDAPLSPDGRMLASAGEPGTIVLWDVTTRARVGELKGGFGLVTTAEFDGTGTRLAVGTGQGEVLLWDVPTRRLIAQSSVPDAFYTDLVFTVDGRQMVTTGAKRGATSETLLWDTGNLTSTVLGTSQGHRTTLAMAPNGTTMAATSLDGSVQLWDIAGRTVVGQLPGNGEPAGTVAYSPDGTSIAVGSRDATIRIWDTTSRTLVAQLHGHRAEIGSVRFGGDGTRLYSADHDGGVLVWDVARRATIARLAGGKPEWLSPLSVSADGRFVIAGEAGGGVLMWDRDQQPLLGHTGNVSGVVYAPDGRTLFSTALDRSLVAWDVDRRVPRGAVSAAQSDDPWSASPTVSHDGSLMATISGLTEVTVRRTDTLQPVGKVTGLRASPSKVLYLQGNTLAITDNGPTVVLWNGTRTDIPLAGTPVDLAASPDGRMLAVVFATGKIHILDTRTHAILHTVDFHTNHMSAAGFSPDGSMLVTSAHDGTAVVWDTTTWQRKTELPARQGRVRAAVFSPDSRLLAVAGTDDTVSLWDMATGTQWAILTGHTEAVTSLAWHPNGRTLTSGNRDQSITPWVVDVDHATDLLCESLRRDFPGNGCQT